MSMSAPVAERVERFLADLEATPLARHVLAVVVCGSAARGEEIWDGDRLVSDIDMMLVTRRTDPRLSAAAEVVLARHASDGIDGGPVPLGPLRRYVTLLFYETRACGVVVSGELRLDDLIPRLRPEELPPWEGFRVLANRSLEHVKARAGLIAAERAVAKTYEALAEAHLVAEGRYRPTYAERLEELERQPPAAVPEPVTERLVATLRRRLGASGPAPDADLPAARADLAAGLALLGERCTGQPGDAARQLALLARGRPHWRQRAYWSAVMLAAGRWSSLTPHVDPMIRIWQRAVDALADPAIADGDKLLLDDWRRCPQVLSRRSRSRSGDHTSVGVTWNIRSM